MVRTAKTSQIPNIELLVVCMRFKQWSDTQKSRIESWCFRINEIEPHPPSSLVEVALCLRLRSTACYSTLQEVHESSAFRKSIERRTGPSPSLPISSIGPWYTGLSSALDRQRSTSSPLNNEESTGEESHGKWTQAHEKLWYLYRLGESALEDWPLFARALKEMAMQRRWASKVFHDQSTKRQMICRTGPRLPDPRFLRCLAKARKDIDRQ